MSKPIPKKSYFKYGDVVKRLPRREYWTVPEVAQAFGVCHQAVHRACLKYSVGRKLNTGGKGKRVFEREHIRTLCGILQGVPGNKSYEQDKEKNKQG